MPGHTCAVAATWPGRWEGLQHRLANWGMPSSPSMAAPTELVLLCTRALGVSLPAVYLKQTQYSGLAYAGSGTPRHCGMARPARKGSSPGHGCSFRAGSS